MKSAAKTLTMSTAAHTRCVRLDPKTSRIAPVRHVSWVPLKYHFSGIAPLTFSKVKESQIEIKS